MSGNNFVFTAHSPADLPEPIVYTVSWAVGEQGPGVEEWGREGSYSWGAAVTVQEEWGAAAGGVRRAAALAHIWWKHQ